MAKIIGNTVGVPVNEDALVHKTGNEAISGIKTFNNGIKTSVIKSDNNVNIEAEGGFTVNGEELVLRKDIGGTGGDESNIVHKTDDEDIDGVKTFNDGIKTSSIQHDFWIDIRALDGGVKIGGNRDVLNLYNGAAFNIDGDLVVNGKSVIAEDKLWVKPCICGYRNVVSAEVYENTPVARRLVSLEIQLLDDDPTNFEELLIPAVSVHQKKFYINKQLFIEDVSIEYPETSSVHVWTYSYNFAKKTVTLFFSDEIFNVNEGDTIFTSEGLVGKRVRFGIEKPSYETSEIRILYKTKIRDGSGFLDTWVAVPTEEEIKNMIKEYVQKVVGS